MINTLARNTTLRLRPLIHRTFSTGGFPAPRLFDYETVTANLSVPDAISAVENCFAALGRDAVEVPMPMVCNLLKHYHVIYDLYSPILKHS